MWRGGNGEIKRGKRKEKREEEERKNPWEMIYDPLGHPDSRGDLSVAREKTTSQIELLLCFFPTSFIRSRGDAFN